MPDLLEIMSTVAQLIVPDPKASPAMQLWYRWRLTFVACAAFCMMLIAYGGLSWIGYGNIFPGFLRQDTFQNYQNQENKYWEGEIDSNILDLRQKQCFATTAELKSLYWSKISKDIGQWQYLSGKEHYDLPACSDL